MRYSRSLAGLAVAAVAIVLVAAVTWRHMTAAGNMPNYLPFIGRGSDRMPEGTFLETFDGEPAAPTSWRSPRWDVTVHSRSVEHLYELAPMEAGHGSDCSAPPVTHTVTAYEDTVFQCRNHTMTAINDGGYGAIYLTPDHMVDFSTGEAVIRFDVSTLRTSSRDWIDLWITPYEDQLQMPLTDWLPDLSGEPRRAVHITMDLGGNRFFAEVVRDFEAVRLDEISFEEYDTFLTPSAMQRSTFELRISERHVKFGMPAYDFWWIDADMAALGWGRGVVQLGHHSYNPTKDCNDCGPNTWHWDNVFIEPAVPFAMIHADRRFADPTSPAPITFPTAAPQDAHLRFAGIGKNLEVSFDGGATWQAAQAQRQERYDEDHFWSYWTPIPAGTTQVVFRGENWWGGPWHVRDIAIWSEQSDAAALQPMSVTWNGAAVTPADVCGLPSS